MAFPMKAISVSDRELQMIVSALRGEIATGNWLRTIRANAMCKTLKRRGELRVEASDVRMLRRHYAKALVAHRLLIKLQAQPMPQLSDIDHDHVLEKNQIGELVELSK